MRNIPLRVILMPLIGITAALAGGCNIKDKTAAQLAAEKDEYVYVTVTGSNIPKRIKKSDIAAGKVPQDVMAQLMDKEEFAKNIHPAPMKGN